MPLLIVQDLFASPLTDLARYVLPATSFAEKDGTFVNHANLAQAIHWAVRPLDAERTEGQILLDLLGRKGLVHAPTLREEVGSKIPYFAPMAHSEPGENGVRLEKPRVFEGVSLEIQAP